MSLETADIRENFDIDPVNPVNRPIPVDILTKTRAFISSEMKKKSHLIVFINKIVHFFLP